MSATRHLCRARPGDWVVVHGKSLGSLPEPG